MYARTITIDARPEAFDAGIALVRGQIFDAVIQTPGCVGMSLVADRQSGRCIATSAWESEQAMHDSDARVMPLRHRAAETLGGPAQVEEWEVALMHRDHRSSDGSCVRSTWIQGAPTELEASIEVFKSTTLPALEGFDGFCSASLLVSRSTGRALATIAYDSREALERTREQANALRARTATEMGSGVQDVREFDLLLAHLHLPEMV